MMTQRDCFVLLIQTMCICERALSMSPGDALLVLGDAMQVHSDALLNVNPVDAAAEWWGWRRNGGLKPEWLLAWEQNETSRNAMLRASLVSPVPPR